jgi:hypothetical protein
MKKLWITLVGLFTKKANNSITTGPASQWPPMHSNGEGTVNEVEGLKIAKKPSQQETVVLALETNGIVSVNDLKGMGVTRTIKIISELRKKGWEIKTQYIFADGSKKDILYVLFSIEKIPVKFY